MDLIRKLRPYFWALGLHVSLMILVSVGYVVLGAPHHLPRFWIGGGLGGMNVVAVLWTVRRLMAKKPIALTVAVSVFKYGFLIALIWLAIRSGTALGFSFFVGLILMLPSLVFITYLMNKHGNKWFILTGHN